MLSQKIELFLLEMEANGSSPANIATYENRLKRVAAYLPSRLSKIRPEDVSQAIVALRRQPKRFTSHPTRATLEGGLAPATIAGHVQAIKTFFNWCHNRGYTPINLAAHIKKGGYDHLADDRKMTKDDFDAMYKLAHQYSQSNDKMKIRTAAMFFFACDTACRLGELTNLRIPWLDLSGGMARVNGKTKRGIVYFTPATITILKRWLAVRPSCSHDCLWVGFKNPFQPLGVSGVYQSLRRLAKAAGVRGRFAPQAIRHLNGYIYTSKANLAVAQKKLRHKDVAITAKFYAHQESEEVRLATLVLSLVSKPPTDNS